MKGISTRYIGELWQYINPVNALKLTVVCCIDQLLCHGQAWHVAVSAHECAAQPLSCQSACLLPAPAFHISYGNRHKLMGLYYRFNFVFHPQHIYGPSAYPYQPWLKHSISSVATRFNAHVLCEEYFRRLNRSKRTLPFPCTQLGTPGREQSSSRFGSASGANRLAREVF